MPSGSPEPLTTAQQELYDWLADYIGSHHHSPSIRQMMQGITSGIPVLGAVAAGGLVEAFDDVQERLDLGPVLETRGLFALTVNGDSMVDAHIADGDVVLMEPVTDAGRIRQGTIVSALVPGSGTTLKHFHCDGVTVRLEAANPAYEPIELPADQVQVQGKLAAVWRQM